ncbi:uncharacterized protein LOC128856261 [Anastrepha ludens]|uniref:uncharacterized protein LOC128856261 n=1 Tax=Anastrepha ludens TaxID=28586 RepID=UPI0023B1342C|nr:uncharacterized protein LOC128856261 [Anastrepha ludens]
MWKMSKYFLIAVILAIFYVAGIQAQTPNCTPRIVSLRRGQRVCQRNCPPRVPPYLCVTATKDIRIPVCPSGCCRAGNICVPIKRPG